jgi:hypothetical protein
MTFAGPMKTYEKVLVGISLLVGVPVAAFVIPHDIGFRMFSVICGGAIAFIDLTLFYYRHYEEAGYEPDRDALDRYALEILALVGFVYGAAVWLLPGWR